MKKLFLFLASAILVMTSKSQNIEFIELIHPPCEDEQGYCKVTSNLNPTPNWNIMLGNGNSVSLFGDTVDFNFDYQVLTEIYIEATNGVFQEYANFTIEADFPVYDLGNDTTIESGETLLLDPQLVPTTNYNFDWYENGNWISSSPTITCDATGEIVCIVTDQSGCQVNDTLNLIVNAPLVNSIIELTNSNVEVFPNPTATILKIRTDNFKVAELFTLDGKLVKKTTSSQLDVSDLDRGTYLIIINDSYMEKVILN